MDFWPYIGYMASALIIISFAMRNLKLLRWINLLGCALFVIYGVQQWDWPIIITNAAIVCINVYYLFIRKDKAT